MNSRRHHLIARTRILLLLTLLVALGFLATSLASYQVSKTAIQESISGRELPLTSDNIYTEIQKDLIRPIFISSMMASDTFLRDWILHGETDIRRMTRFLGEVKTRFNAFTSFFVSERTLAYYHTNGILKHVRADEPRDAWYFRVRQMSAPYEINVDPDLANRDALTIFINYRVLDYEGRILGTTGIGLTVDAVRQLIASYQQRYQRNIYFTDRQGKLILFGNHSPFSENDIHAVAGLRDIADQLLATPAGSYRYIHRDKEHFLNVRLVPELNWYLFVEKVADDDLSAIRRTLYINLGFSLAITLIVVLLGSLTLRRYQNRLEAMATTDALTGLYNRQAMDILFQQAVSEHRRQPKPIAIALVDIDHFKQINDNHGHLVGDHVIAEVARLLTQGLRGADIACRWGGEEFLLIFKDCTAADALTIAEKIRQRVAQAEFVTNGITLGFTISIGVAGYHAGDALEPLIAAADAALYTAKQSGRNRVSGPAGAAADTAF
jgi:diguanylate cyclase (GGDEF)-like protein